MAAAAARNERTHFPAGAPATRCQALAGRPAPVRTAAADAPTSVWWARVADRGPRSAEHSLVGVNSARFPDGTPVDMTAIASRGRRPAGWLVDVRFRRTDGTVVGIDVAGLGAAAAPPLWFAELHHATSGLPSASLLAFRGTAFRPGSLVHPHHVAAAGVRMADRVGELRWYTRSGLVDTVVVDPALRRRGVGRTLVTVTEALRVLRGWAPLRSDGRLTDLGAAWLDSAPACWRPRLAERTEVLPDAGGDRPTGVARLLR